MNTRPLCMLMLWGGMASTLATLRADASEGSAESRSVVAPRLSIVTLGDSITKGVRPGVASEATFPAIVTRHLQDIGIEACTLNLGVGGERTDQALLRIDAVTAGHPRVVTVMYGTNDSYVDPGASESRISASAFADNLQRIVTELTSRGIAPILMTEPRWAASARNGLDESPNLRLAAYMQACRDVAERNHVPLVDHFAHWTAAAERGQPLEEWTTDGCHPNDRGHDQLAKLLIPTLLRTVEMKSAVRLRSGRRIPIVCFGDSVTGVYYHTGGLQAYPEMLQIAIQKTYPRADVKVINAGVSGHTTADGLARIDRDVLAHEPAIVTVMFGLNDMVRVPLDAFRANLRRIVERCHEAGAEVLLVTPNTVIDTAARPQQRLLEFVRVIRDVGHELEVPVADCHQELNRLRESDAFAWRMLMSDEIHPNMDGHKRIAETLVRSITGYKVSLIEVGPPLPPFAHTREAIEAGRPVKVMAMPPFDESIEAALRSRFREAQVEVIPWETQGRTLVDLEQAAKRRVRMQRPDLVVLSVPRKVTAEAGSREAFVSRFTGIMNGSLSFGRREWDVVVVHPSVAEPAAEVSEQDALVRRLVTAQHLTLIDRGEGDERPAAELLIDAIQRGD